MFNFKKDVISGPLNYLKNRNIANLYLPGEDKTTIDQHISEAMNWLMRAQDAGDNRGISYGVPFGGDFFASYPETTGYICQTFVDQYMLNGDSELLSRAREMADWEAQVAYVVETLSAVEGVTSRRVYPGEPGIQPIWIPRAYVDWTPEVTQRSPLELKEELFQGEPRVVVGTSATGLVVNPQMLEPGQERIMVDCIKRVLSKGK